MTHAETVLDALRCDAVREQWEAWLDDWATSCRAVYDGTRYDLADGSALLRERSGTWFRLDERGRWVR